MERAAVDVVSAGAVRHPRAGTRRLPNFRAIAALLVLALRQQVRGWRPVMLTLLFLLPIGLVTLAFLTSPETQRRPSPGGMLEFTFLFNLIPHAMAPLAALLCSAGIIRDEIEEQTLTYVLLRPISRAAIYAVKLLASLLISALFTSFSSVATLLFMAWLTGGAWNAALFVQGAKIAAIFSLAQVAYCGLFALVALLVRRALLIGVVYIIVLEGILVIFDTIARRITVMYYFRVLVLRWLAPPAGAQWKFNLLTAPSAARCVEILLAAGLVLTIAGGLIFAATEFRMKTPEGE
jgi:ABC-2 type transport system permease protein